MRKLFILLAVIGGILSGCVVPYDSGYGNRQHHRTDDGAYRDRDRDGIPNRRDRDRDGRDGRAERPGDDRVLGRLRESGQHLHRGRDLPR